MVVIKVCEFKFMFCWICVVQTQAPTPDGHRAPIADLLNIRSVNTQTPSGGFYHSGIEKHFLRILEDGDDSPSLPIIPGAGEMTLLLNRPTSAGSDKSHPCERVITGNLWMHSLLFPGILDAVGRMHRKNSASITIILRCF